MKHLLLICIVGDMLGPNPAFAHRDHEAPVTTLQDARGNSFVVVRHYTDGIVMVDPVKLVVCDIAGVVVAETPYFRDVLIDAAQDGTLCVFGVDLFGLSFWNGWALKEGNLVPLTGPSSFWQALWASLSDHWLGYGFTFLLPWVAAFITRRRAKLGRKWKTELAGLGVIWLCATVTYIRLAILLTIGIYSLGTLALLLWLRRTSLVKAPMITPTSF